VADRAALIGHASYALIRWKKITERFTDHGGGSSRRFRRPVLVAA
jgi:hypothetical protein